MRPIEVLLMASTLLGTLAALLFPSRRGIGIGLAVLAVAVFVAHAAVEGMHWQMIPVYLAVLVLGGLLAVHGTVLRFVLASGIVLLLAAGVAFSVYLPMFQLPAPTGPYAIGTQIIPLVNEHPHDPTSAGADGKRALMIQVWYPADASHGPRAPYRIARETTLLSSYQAVDWTHARWNAPFLSGATGLPVLLLNPAWNGRRTYYMYLVEELVSHGYVVVGVDHTGNTGPIAFPDGHVTQPLPDPKLDFDTHSFAELNAYGGEQQAIQVEDNRFVLDQLERWNEDASSLYYHRVDTQKVGAFGHSFGGSVAAQDCLDDPRFKAALDMDGSFWGPVQKAGATMPLMMIEEDYAVYSPEELQRDHNAAMDHQFDLSDDVMMSRSNGYRIVLHGSTHSSFSDRSLFSPFKRYSGEGDIPALHEYSVIRSYALAFFDKTLKGIDSPLLSAGDHMDREMTFTVLRRPASP